MEENRLNLRVQEKTLLAHNIASYELVSTDGNALPEFTAGSHIDVYLNNGLVRQYSLFNRSEEKNRYCIAVLRTEDSRGGSIAMHDLIMQGDVISTSTPRNNFQLIEDSSNSILFAGGIGITPILSMAERLDTLNSRFQLHYCARSQESTAFYEYLPNTSFHEKVNFHFDNGDKKQQLDIARVIAESPIDSDIYVCGPAGFMDAVIAIASEKYSMDRIYREYFNANPNLSSDKDQAFTVKLHSTGEEFKIPPEQSIVEVLREHDIEIQVACEQGICGTCLTSIVEGVPLHRDTFMTEDEHNANNKITPCCSRALTDLLVLDL